MPNSFSQLSIPFLVLLLGNFSDAEVDDPSIDQDLPLVLIKTWHGLRSPSEVEMKRAGLFGKKNLIQFIFNDYFDQGFYCPPENEDQRNKLVEAIQSQNQAKGLTKEKIDEHCLFKKRQTGEVPAPQCQKQPHPKIMKMIEKNPAAAMENGKAVAGHREVPCGPNGVGKILAFGYQVCVEYEGSRDKMKIFNKESVVHPLKETREVICYYMCYNAATNEILYTSNAIRGSQLFSDIILEKDRNKTWPIETYNSAHLSKIDFEQVEWKFEEVTKLSNFGIQLLVHPEDQAMGLWKKPAYHFANASLIHKDLQQCWNSIHAKIEENVWKVPKYVNWNFIDVLTGAFKLPEIGPPKTIADVEIPKIWVKIVHNKFTAVIIANNYREQTVDDFITALLKCKVNLCKKFIDENFPDVMDNIRCCALTDEILGLFGTELKSSGVLEIDGLITGEPLIPGVSSGSLPTGTYKRSMRTGGAEASFF